MRQTFQHPKGERILACLDGELPRAEADSIRAHCAECAECGRMLREFAAVHDALAGRALAEPLRPVWPAVRDRMEGAERKAFRPVFAAATAAAALAGVLIGVLVGSIGERRSRSEGVYLWSVIGTSISGESGASLPDPYEGAPSEEGS